jgi:hypothetical protein
MATIAQFTRNMRSRASKIRNADVRLVQEVASTVLYQLASNTPVDKGVARSNWRVSRVVRTTAVIPAHAPGHKLGMQETQNLEITMQDGLAQLDQLREGQALFITNNAPYIEKLNASHATQAGFIDSALLHGKMAVNNFKVFQR